MARTKIPPGFARRTAASSSPAGGVAKLGSSVVSKRNSSPRKTEDVRLREEAEAFTRTDLGSFIDEVDVPGSRRSKRVRQAPKPVYEPAPLPAKKKATPKKKKWWVGRVTEPVDGAEEEEEVVVVPVKAKAKTAKTAKKAAKKPAKKAAKKPEPVEESDDEEDDEEQVDEQVEEQGEEQDEEQDEEPVTPEPKKSKKPAKKPAKKRKVIEIPDTSSSEESEDDDDYEVIIVKPETPEDLVEYITADPEVNKYAKLFNNREKDQAAKWEKIVDKLDNVEDYLNRVVGMEPPKIAGPKKATPKKAASKKAASKKAAPTTPEHNVGNPLRMAAAAPGSSTRKRLHDDDGTSPGEKRAKKVKAAKEDAEEAEIPQLDGLEDSDDEDPGPEYDSDVDSDPEPETGADEVMKVFNARHPKGNKTGISTTPQALVYEPLLPFVHPDDQAATESHPGIVDTIAEPVKLAQLFSHHASLEWDLYEGCEGDEKDRATRKAMKSRIHAVECQSSEHYAMAAWLRANYQWQHPGWDADDDSVNNATNPSPGRKKSKAGAKPKLGKRELGKLAKFAKERYLAYIGRTFQLQRVALKRSRSAR